MKMFSNITDRNITYLDYSTSSFKTGNIESSSDNESLLSIMKDNTIFLNSNVYIKEI